MSTGPISSLYASLGMDSAQFESGAKRAQQVWNGLGGNIRSGASQIERSTERLGSSMTATSRAAEFLASSLAGLGVAAVAVQTARLADGYTQFTNRLKTAGLEGEALAATQADLYAVAQKYGVELESLGTLFGRLSGAGKDLGATQDQLLRFTTGVAAALKVQGGSAADSAGALLQLSQALSGTKIQAEEYNSLIDGARPLLQAVANGSDRFKGSVSALTKAVKDGEVTSREFFEAALRGFGSLEAQADKSAMTIGNSLTVLNNALGKYIGQQDQALSATERVSGAITGLAGSLDTIIPTATALIGLVGVRYAAAGAAFVATSTAKAAASARDAIAADMAAAANARLAAAGLTASASAARFTTAVTASAVATRMAGGVASGLIGLLGGPWGVAFTAAAASVWLVHKALTSLDQPGKEVVKTTTAMDAATAAYAEAAQDAALASDEERDAALQNAAAKKAQAEETIRAARAKLEDAKATLAQIEAEVQRRIENSGNPLLADPEGQAGYFAAQAGRQKRALAEIEALRKKIEENAKGIASADRILRAGTTSVIEETEEERKAREKAAKDAAKARERAAKDAKKDSAERLADAREVIDGLLTEDERYVKEFNENLAKLDKAREGGELSAEEYTDALLRMLAKLRQESVEAAADLQDVDFTVAFGTAKDWDAAVKNIDGVSEKLNDLLASLDDVLFGFEQLRHSLSRGDWSGALQGLLGAVSGLAGAFRSGGVGGLMGGVGSIAQQVIGGRTGRAVGGGLGLAGMGLGVGHLLTTNALPAVGALTGMFGVSGAGAIAGMMSTVGGLLGPIGIAAGALYAAAKLFNVGGKPSNAGAGFDLVSGRVSGNKRTAETEQAAKAAGDAILEAQKTFEAAGIKLGDTITGLVIGTRDLTQIYTASGRTLTSAVGDAAAATDAAVKAMLDGANFASEAQEKLVRSMVAAGKGFDDIAAALQAYQAAQGIGQAIADEILRLTDPKKFDLQQVERAAEAQRKAVEDAVKAGYLTAEQSSDILKKLAELTGLQLADVEETYAGGGDLVSRRRALEIELMEALGNAEGALAARRADELEALRKLDPALAAVRQRIWAIEDASAAVAEARREYDEAVRQEQDRQRQEMQETVSRLRALTGSLRDFRKELFLGSAAMLSPQQRYAASRAEFERIAALAKAGDRDAMEQLQAVSEEYLDAAREAAPDAEAYAKDLAAVRSAVASTETIANSQLSAAEAQLVALEGIQVGVNSVALALEKLANALVQLEVAKGRPIDPTFDVQRYLANNPDLAKNWNAGGSLHGLAATLEEAARIHFENTGRHEIAAGLRRYARGGFHPGGLRLVGEEGAEIEATGPARYYSSAETARMLTGGDPELAGELRRQNELAVEQNILLRRTAKSVADTTIILRRVTRDGDSLVTEAA